MGNWKTFRAARATGDRAHRPLWPQLAEELDLELQSRQRLEGERRESESNWEAQITDILSW